MAIAAKTSGSTDRLLILLNPAGGAAPTKKGVRISTAPTNSSSARADPGQASEIAGFPLSRERPIYARAATCWQLQVKRLTIIVNRIYNGWRIEDVWLDK
jgi:hypothetical protein